MDILHLILSNTFPHKQTPPSMIKQYGRKQGHAGSSGKFISHTAVSDGRSNFANECAGNENVNTTNFYANNSNNNNNNYDSGGNYNSSNSSSTMYMTPIRAPVLKRAGTSIAGLERLFAFMRELQL